MSKIILTPLFLWMEQPLPPGNPENDVAFALLQANALREAFELTPAPAETNTNIPSPTPEPEPTPGMELNLTPKPPGM